MYTVLLFILGITLSLNNSHWIFSVHLITWVHWITIIYVHMVTWVQCVCSPPVQCVWRQWRPPGAASVPECQQLLYILPHLLLRQQGNTWRVSSIKCTPLTFSSDNKEILGGYVALKALLWPSPQTTGKYRDGK